MNSLYKSVFLDKISKFPCYISYKVGKYSFEKPFRITDYRSLETLMESPNVKLLDCTTNSLILMDFDDILMFYIRHEDDRGKCEEELQKTLTDNKNTFSKFKFLSGLSMYDLFFRNDIEESRDTRLRNMLLLDLAHIDSLEDYDRLLSNDESMIKDFRNGWYQFIVNKYNEITGSLDEEVNNANDESVVLELQSIKEILECIPKEAEKELSTKKSIEEIMDYWPTLLLPKVNFELDTFDFKPKLDFKLKRVNAS